MAALISKTKVSKKEKEAAEIEKKTIKEGLQALLRDRLYSLYEKANVSRVVALHEKDNFNNLYKYYEILGENGVMDDIKEDYMSFETKGE